MGGIGKTTICKVMCHKFQFLDAVCHLEFGSKSDLELMREAVRKFTDSTHVPLESLDEDKVRSQYIWIAIHS